MIHCSKLKPFLFVYDLWNCYVKIQKVSWILAQPHATSSEIHEENDGNIKKEQAKVDSMIKQAGEQTDKELENELSKLKSLIESLIQQEEVCANMNVEVRPFSLFPLSFNLNLGHFISTVIGV